MKNISTTAEKVEEMKNLVKVLDDANKAYYKFDKEIMSNFEYDKLYDQLLALEEETGIILSSSPTQKVGYEVSDFLSKEEHDTLMLSLDKTKDREALRGWLGDKEGVLSWKLDGLTVVLTYENGSLSKAVTRGNGQIGEVVTSNARTFKNVPLNISFKKRLVIRGEAYITYKDFENINDEIEDVDAKYKNPRNLVSGSVRQLNSEMTAKRNVNFRAFSVGNFNDIKDEAKIGNSFSNQLKWLENLGFDVVENTLVNEANLVSAIENFSNKIKDFPIPSDGLVLCYDDIAYGASLGTTSKFPRNAIAFKWQDEIKETTLKYIEWSPSRTGLVNPIAIFEPVDLEGTVVSRASVHNVSILKELQLSEGDTIKVYKANMIIPQIADNLTRKGKVILPDKCPSCNSSLFLQKDMDVEVLICKNDECPAKKIKSLALFVSRDAMNIENLSEATLEKFASKGLIKDFVDIYRLEKHKEVIVSMEGFGEKSYAKLIGSVNKSRETVLSRFIYALGIDGIGVSNSKLMAKYFSFELDKIMMASEEELQQIEGFGSIMASSVSNYFKNEKNTDLVNRLRRELNFNDVISESPQTLKGKTFVITGSLNHYENRNKLKEEIESLGGKVAGSVSSKTDYLINNDNLSTSSKNKKAMELGIPIITEEEAIQLFKG